MIRVAICEAGWARPAQPIDHSIGKTGMPKRAAAPGLCRPRLPRAGAEKSSVVRSDRHGDSRVMPSCDRIEKHAASLGSDADGPQQTARVRSVKLQVRDVSRPRLHVEACERPVTEVERSLVRKTATVRNGSICDRR